MMATTYLEEDKLDEMYKRYKSRTDDEIRELLKRIMIVDNKAGKYYQLTDDLLKKVINKPRGYSPVFDPCTKKFPVKGLEPIKEITYLVKSSSRFFFKPDIGEIFDQLDDCDLKGVSAISISGTYALIDGTDGEHYTMEATLLRKDREAKLKRILNG